ncbi:MAG TPA: S26 family signal peptidase [Gaiellaceae bacterium]|nr:S26 family signal peptidase [Gaiellaceae bacterium]
MRNPLDRLTYRVPEPSRSILDWTLSIVVAVVAVLAVKVEVANPYRVPSASMEPTLHCARPADGCLAAHSDRVVANRFIYRFRDPKRGEIVVFDALREPSRRAPRAARS